MNETQTILDRNKGQWTNRVLIGTPMTGLVRSEWVVGRYGQVIPTNWSHIEVMQWMSSYIPLQYQVADAENVIAKHVVERDFQWLFFIEHDNVLPPNTFVKMNQYMLRGDIPVVGALYFTKSEPPEPMIYRKPGWGYYRNWKMGDKVWCRGIPFGCSLIHGSLIRALWEESPEYQVGNTITRRVFKQPENVFADPDSPDFLMTQGTSDLQFCDDVIKKDIFKKAGWPQYAKKKFPFLIDTSIMVKHIDNDGIQWPTYIPKEFQPCPPKNGNKRTG